MSIKSLIGNTLFAAIVFISVAVPAAAQGSRDWVAEQAALVSEFDVNGLKVIVKRRAAAPTVAGGLFIRGGVRNIDEKNAGIETLMLMSAIEAGKNMPRQTVRRELSRTGSALSSGAVKDYSVVSFAATRQNFDRVWEILTEVTLNPAFNEEDVNRSREQLLVGLRESEVSPEGALSALQDRIIYAGHPYEKSPLGTTKTIASLTVDDLRAHHKKVMQTSQLLLVVVGDLDVDELKKKAAASFGKLPQGNYKETGYSPLDFAEGSLDITQRSLPTNYIRGSFQAPSVASPDYSAMRVAVMILASLVHSEVRERRQLSYAPGAEMNNHTANTANISVTATDANQAVSVMLQQIGLLQTRMLTDEAIEGIANTFVRNYYLDQETNAAQAGELARYELIGGGWRNSFEFLNRIHAVKAADVQAAARKYMRNIRFAVVGDPAAIDRKIFVPAASN